MTERSVWTGPAVSNPRNRKGSELVAHLSDQDSALREALRGTAPAIPFAVEIMTEDGDILSGRTDSDTSWSPRLGMLVFHFWKRPSLRLRIANRILLAVGARTGLVQPFKPSDHWRVMYIAEVSLPDGRITVTPVAIAPDEDDGSAPPSQFA